MAGGLYPLPADVDEWIRDRTPSELRHGLAWSLVRAAGYQLADLDRQQAEMVTDLDPRVATGRSLDQAGERVGERRGGLGDDEYRLIILGREAAAMARGTWAGVTATWLALTGATVDQIRAYRVPASGLPCVLLEAEIGWTPTRSYLVRAAEVLRDTVIDSYDVSATVYRSGALRYGTPPPFGSAVWSWGIL